MKKLNTKNNQSEFYKTILNNVLKFKNTKFANFIVENYNFLNKIDSIFTLKNILVFLGVAFISIFLITSLISSIMIRNTKNGMIDLVINILIFLTFILMVYKIPNIIEIVKNKFNKKGK